MDRLECVHAHLERFVCGILWAIFIAFYCRNNIMFAEDVALEAPFDIVIAERFFDGSQRHNFVSEWSFQHQIVVVSQCMIGKLGV